MKNFDINIRDSYPKIISPTYLKDASNHVIRIDELYPGVQEPTYTPLKIADDYEKSILSIVWVAIVIGFVIFIAVGFFCMFLTLFINISKQEWAMYWYPSILVIGILGGIAFIILALKANRVERERKEKLQKENYNKYLNELQKYKKLLKAISSSEFQKKQNIEYCFKKSEENKKTIFKNLEILEDGSVKKGISEDFFHKYLNRYSDFKVYKSVKFSYYYPDLILVKDNLIMVLEIDEPYSFDSKEPIHYENSDEKRDNYFVDNGFVLIRFSENQIISYPEICLDLICEVFDSCLNVENYTKTGNYILIEEKPWTHEEAFDFAYKNSRSEIPSIIKNLEKEYLL